MKRMTTFAAVVVWTVAALATTARAAEPPMEKPQEAHRWLEQLLGDWKTDATATVAPGQEFQCEGTAKFKSLGGFWAVMQLESQPMGQAMHGIMTIGYDPHAKQYVGTWVDSTTSRLWKYEGSLDETGKILTLEADGPNFLAPNDPTKTAKFRDIIEVKGNDHLVMTSAVELEPGKWTKFMTMNFRRAQ